MNRISFPFTAIEGQEDFKLCLLLSSIDNSLGGVLAMGDKGTGKTTTARAFASLMKRADPGFTFINLPIGASEDRVLGAVKLDTLINEKKIEVHKGLLAQSNHGILYVDEVNLLDDYLMDVMLDASSSGGYYLEREGISQWMDSKFCLVGTMNPEEGSLRPQLLDRFGLSVQVKTPSAHEARINIMKSRIAFDTDPNGFFSLYEKKENELAETILLAKKNLANTFIPSTIFEEAAHLCIQHQVEGLRADILLVKASRAMAAFEKSKEVNKNHLIRISSFVLNHRSKNPSAPPKSPHQKAPEHQGEEKEEEMRLKTMN